MKKMLFSLLLSPALFAGISHTSQGSFVNIYADKNFQFYIIKKCCMGARDGVSWYIVKEKVDKQGNMK